MPRREDPTVFHSPSVDFSATTEELAEFASKADERARVDELLAMTPLGQQVLRDRTAKEQKIKDGRKS